MKKTNHPMVLTMLLLSVFIASCEKDTPVKEYEYTYSNSYLRDTILYHIEKQTIGTTHLFVVNEKVLLDSEINNKISSLKKEDIISITLVNKADAVKEYTSAAKDGAVKINYYIDPLLKPSYYNITNQHVLNIINDLISQGKVVRFPLIVLDGKPLRGTEIREFLDKLNNETINSIFVLDLDAGLQLYGERAINGVVIFKTL